MGLTAFNMHRRLAAAKSRTEPSGSALEEKESPVKEETVKEETVKEETKKPELKKEAKAAKPQTEKKPEADGDDDKKLF